MSKIEWLDKETMVYVHSGILPGCKKKNQIIIFAVLNGAGDYNAEWLVRRRGKYPFIIHFICKI